MEKRLLGRTGHSSTVVTFGAIVLGKSNLPQKKLDSFKKYLSFNQMNQDVNIDFKHD